MTGWRWRAAETAILSKRSTIVAIQHGDNRQAAGGTLVHFVHEARCLSKRATTGDGLRRSLLDAATHLLIAHERDRDMTIGNRVGDASELWLGKIEKVSCKVGVEDFTPFALRVVPEANLKSEKRQKPRHTTDASDRRGRGGPRDTCTCGLGCVLRNATFVAASAASLQDQGGLKDNCAKKQEKKK